MFSLVRVHDLRHAHASWLLAGGSDLKSVMDILSARTTAHVDLVGQTGLVSTRSRQGQKVDGSFTFTCASCGRPAATLEVIDEERQIDGGPMPGGHRLTWKPGTPSFRLEFVNVCTGEAPAGLVELVSGVDVVDPLVVRRLDWELAAFCCVSCRLNYCPTCWTTWAEFDDGFFDCMRGRCPRGHEQMLAD